MTRAVYLISGIQGAGKSTVGALLAQRLDPAAFIEGDLLWRMVVSGREDMAPSPSDEAVRQLHLRYRHGALLADSFFEAGFSAVHSEIILGEDVERYEGWVSSRPLHVVMLAPRPEVVVERERARGSAAYAGWGASLEEAVRGFQRFLDDTPRRGFWIDTSDLTPDETVDEILERLR